MKKVKQNLYKTHYRAFPPSDQDSLEEKGYKKNLQHKYLTSLVGKTENSSCDEDEEEVIFMSHIQWGNTLKSKSHNENDKSK